MKFYNARNEMFHLGTLDGKIVAFTNTRIDHDTVPEGLFCYDVRDSDCCDGTFAEVIEGNVLINHWGTIITKTPFKLEDGSYYPEDDDMCYHDESILIEVFNSIDELELWNYKAVQQHHI